MNLLYSSAVLSSLKSSTRTILTSSQSGIGTKPSTGKGVQTSIRTSSQEYVSRSCRVLEDPHILGLTADCKEWYEIKAK